jgi:DHA1 family inner membrane transport protein
MVARTKGHVVDKTRWGMVALIFLLGLFAAAQFGKVSLTLPALMARYGLAETQAGWLVSLVGAVGLVFGAVAGTLVARFGTRTALMWAIVLGGGASVAQATLPPFAGMAALRVLEGVSHLAIVVAAPPIMAAMATPRDRPVVMSIWAMFFGLSFAVSAVIIPVILDAGGLPLVFGLHGAGLWLVGLALVLRLGRDDAAPVTLAPWRLHMETYSRLHTCAPALGFLCYTVCFLALLTFLPAALNRPDLAVTLPLVSLAATLSAGYLARRFAPDRVALAGFLLSLAGAGAILVGLPLAAEATFFMLGSVPGACFAAIPYFNATPADRARATGALAQMGNLGTVSGTPVFALLVASDGVRGLMHGLIVFCVAGVIILATIGPRLRADHG